MRKKEEKEFRQMHEKEELMRRKEEEKQQKRREKEERMLKKADEARLKKETQKWEKEIRDKGVRRRREERERRREIKKEYEQKERFRIAKKKLESKFKKIGKQGENLRPILVSEAIRKNTSKWMIPGGGFKDPLVFLESTTPAVERLINSIDCVGKKVHTVLVCKMGRTNPETGKDTLTIAHFSSKTHSMIIPGNEGKNVRKPCQIPKAWKRMAITIRRNVRNIYNEIQTIKREKL